MKPRTFMIVINVFTVAAIAVYFALGRIEKHQLLIVVLTSLLITNLAAILGLKARRRRADAGNH